MSLRQFTSHANSSDAGATHPGCSAAAMWWSEQHFERSMIVETYLSTDEQHDVLISLREVLHQVERVTAGDIHCWKWAVIALASAVNGALTCNLSGTMQVGALREEDAESTIAALQKDAATEMPPRPRLAPPDVLLKRARRDDKRVERAGPTLTISPHQKRSFDRVFEFRNAFLHFEPLGWSIETSGMPSIFENVLQIVGQTLADGWSFRHLDDHDRAELERVLHDVTRRLEELGRSAD